MTQKFVKIVLVGLLSLSLSHIPEVAAAEVAGRMIPTSVVVESLSRADLEAKVQGFLERQDLQDQLRKMGVNPEEAAKRVASLSQDELNQLSKQMDQVRYGGDVVGILLVVLLVLVIIYFAKRV